MGVVSYKFEETPEDLWAFKVKGEDLYGHPHYEQGKLAGIQIGMGIIGALCLPKEDWEKAFAHVLKDPAGELVQMKEELKKQQDGPVNP